MLNAFGTNFLEKNEVFKKIVFDLRLVSTWRSHLYLTIDSTSGIAMKVNRK